MTTKELMTPRYKAIADYPRGAHQKGDVFICIDWLHEDLEFYDQYPHLFRKLEWWEERAVDDMPEYIKNISSGRIEKVIDKTNDDPEVITVIGHDGSKKYRSLRHVLPSTEGEFINNLNSKQP